MYQVFMFTVVIHVCGHRRYVYDATGTGGHDGGQQTILQKLISARMIIFQ